MGMEAIQFGSRKQCSIWELETLPACSTINLAVLLCTIAKELAQLLQLLIKDMLGRSSKGHLVCLHILEFLSVTSFNYHKSISNILGGVFLYKSRDDSPGLQREDHCHPSSSSCSVVAL